MRNNRIEVEFGQGTDTILLEVETNRVWSYETDREELHNLHGGKQYYFSRSGLSGAGYLEPDSDHSLLLVGGYRVDAPSVRWGGASLRTFNEKEVFAYFPTRSHKGITNDLAVVSDGQIVVPCFQGEVLEVVNDWHLLPCHNYKPRGTYDEVSGTVSRVKDSLREFTWYDFSADRERIHEWHFVPVDGYRLPVNPIHFVDLRGPRDSQEDWFSRMGDEVEIEELGPFTEHMGLVLVYDHFTGEEPRWFRRTIHNILDGPVMDPHSFPPSGWSLLKDYPNGVEGGPTHIFWTRRGNNVVTFTPTTTRTFTGVEWFTQCERCVDTLHALDATHT